MAKDFHSIVQISRNDRSRTASARVLRSWATINAEDRAKCSDATQSLQGFLFAITLSTSLQGNGHFTHNSSRKVSLIRHLELPNPRSLTAPVKAPFSRIEELRLQDVDLAELRRQVDRNKQLVHGESERYGMARLASPCRLTPVSPAIITEVLLGGNLT